MKKKSQRIVVLISAILLIAFTVVILGFAKEKKSANNSPVGLFSWKSEALNDPDVFTVADKLRINQLYQFISRSNNTEDVERFVNNVVSAGIDFYALYGEREWALDPTGSKMCEMIDRVNEMNRVFKEHGKSSIKGIVFDVEPYLLDEWDKDSKAVMDSFVKAAKAAYTKRGNLKIMLCIPYYYDTKGFTKELETLIADCCDGVMVMNYYRGKEENHIAGEVNICKKYKKDIISIYELRPTDEQITYYNLGIDAVKNNFKSLQKTYKAVNLGIAYHDYKSVKEVIGRE